MLQVWSEFNITLILSMSRRLLKLESLPLPGLLLADCTLKNFLHATQGLAISK